MLVLSEKVSGRNLLEDPWLNLHPIILMNIVIRLEVQMVLRANCTAMRYYRNTNQFVCSNDNYSF